MLKKIFLFFLITVITSLFITSFLKKNFINYLKEPTGQNNLFYLHTKKEKLKKQNVRKVIHFYKNKPYIRSYEIEFDSNKPKQFFNTLSNIQNLKKTVVKYYKRNSNYSSLINSSYQPILNFIEYISCSTNEVVVNGGGFYYTDNEILFHLKTEYFFNRIKIATENECDASRKRYITLGLYNYKSAYPISFSIFTPKYCTLYSFAEKSHLGDVFLICLSSKELLNKTKYYIFGYSFQRLKNEENNSSNEIKGDLILVDEFDDQIPNNLLTNFYLPIFSLTKNKFGNYILTTNTNIYSIKPNSENYLELKKILSETDLEYFKEFSISFPSPYTSFKFNAPYLFFSQKDNEKKGLVFDIEKERFINVNNESCFFSAPNELFNETIDPFIQGPYKTLIYSVISQNHLRVEQKSTNAGCVTKEGLIDIYINGNNLSCFVKVLREINCN